MIFKRGVIIQLKIASLILIIIVILSSLVSFAIEPKKSKLCEEMTENAFNGLNKQIPYFRGFLAETKGETTYEIISELKYVKDFRQTESILYKIKAKHFNYINTKNFDDAYKFLDDSIEELGKLKNRLKPTDTKGREFINKKITELKELQENGEKIKWRYVSEEFGKKHTTHTFKVDSGKFYIDKVETKRIPVVGGKGREFVYEKEKELWLVNGKTPIKLEASTTADTAESLAEISKLLTENNIKHTKKLIVMHGRNPIYRIEIVTADGKTLIYDLSKGRLSTQTVDLSKIDPKNVKVTEFK